MTSIDRTIYRRVKRNYAIKELIEAYTPTEEERHYVEITARSPQHRLEQRRIVIDVAGPSSAITAIYNRIKEFFSNLHAPDGTPVIGEMERTLDYSEITARFPFSLDTLLAEPFRTLLKSVLPEDSTEDSIMLPTFSARVYPINQELADVPPLNDVRSLSFTLRAGTRPHQHIYLSTTPLNSEIHLRYLQQLEATFSSTQHIET